MVRYKSRGRGDCQGTPSYTQLRMGLRVAGIAGHCLNTLCSCRKTSPVSTVLVCHFAMAQPKPALGPLWSTLLVLCPYLSGTCLPRYLPTGCCSSVATPATAIHCVSGCHDSLHAISPTAVAVPSSSAQSACFSAHHQNSLIGTEYISSWHHTSLIIHNSFLFPEPQTSSTDAPLIDLGRRNTIAAMRHLPHP